MKLYQLLTEKQLNRFLKPYNTNVNDEKIIEIKDGMLFGDFICVSGYKFKLTFGRFQCMETPHHKHKTDTISPIKKAPLDRIWK